MIVLISLPGFL
jgi:hypothetical protein